MDDLNDPAAGPIAAARARFVREHPGLGRRVVAAWRRPPRPVMGWLTYAASYLFTTQGVRWALDPVRPATLLPELAGAPPMEPLGDLSFLLLTHDHADHVDYGLLADLRGSGVRFVVPESMLAAVRAEARPSERQVIVAEHGRRLDLDGVEVLPFAGWHWQPGKGRRRGLDATGYLVEVAGRRWLFPGDVRDYGAPEIGRLGPVDILFAHLWLGRGQAGEAVPPLLGAFCDYMRRCRPRSVVLAHLYEFSRSSADLWRDRHVELVRSRWQATDPGVPLHAPVVGEELPLDPPGVPSGHEGSD